jgi:hypothetical protein
MQRIQNEAGIYRSGVRVGLVWGFVGGAGVATLLFVLLIYFFA